MSTSRCSILTKTETSTGPYAGGDTVTYECVIENVGWATAYELTWEDVLAPDLSDPTLFSVTAFLGRRHHRLGHA